MTEAVDALASMLHVCSNSAPFNLTGANPLYEAVKFRRGYPRGSMETPTVAFHLPSAGVNAPKGLGTVDQWRTVPVQVDILAETELEARRIGEKARAALQRDYNCEGAGAVGDVGNGYVRETGEIKGLDFAEFVPAPWDGGGRKRVVRLTATWGFMIGD